MLSEVADRLVLEDLTFEEEADAGTAEELTEEVLSRRVLGVPALLEEALLEAVDELALDNPPVVW